jgi:hypothetical protein
MPWKPAREVHVKTRAELEAAMLSADRIVVDGDASLAAYAALLAGGAAGSDPGVPPAARLRPIGDLERAAHAPRTARPPRLWPWVGGAAVLTAGAGAALLREHFSRAAATLDPAGGQPPVDLTLLLWPALLVGVLIVLFVVLRMATTEAVHGPPAWRAEAAPRGGGGEARLTMTKVRRHAA